jgi:predicted oxidoreductase
MATGTPEPADVLIVGAGAAGAAAALDADAAGATVLLIDQLETFGGTAATAGGGVCIAGTSTQRAHGILDSPADGLADLLAVADGAADEAWARRYFEHAERDVHDWLVGLGVEFIGFHHEEPDRVPRWHEPRGAGRAVMEALDRAHQARGLAEHRRLGTEVIDLVWQAGRVGGVVGRAAGGEPVELRGRAVIVATGGFAGDLAMVRRFAAGLTAADPLLIGGGRGARGGGHRLLEGVGAELVNMDAVWTYAHATPDYRDSTGERGLVVRGLGSAIWVDRAGRRFTDESRPGPGSATPALLALDPPICWAILDTSMLHGLRIADPYFRAHPVTPPERLEELVTASPWIARASTLEALAAAAGIDPVGLGATFQAWDDLLASGATVDPATGRPLTGVQRYGDPPWIAMRFAPLVRKCLGGVRTDLDGRVLRPDGRPIPGLFAAGELAGFGGGHLAGRRAQEGIMLGGSLYSGRVAGRAAAAEASRAD